MNEIEKELLEYRDEYQSVLIAYRTEQTVRRQTDPEHDGWITRQTSIPHVEESRLARIHGRLIAFGFLKFQLKGRTTGVQYQVSPTGNELMQKLNGSVSQETPEDADAA
ncbi:MAG: hypothetical protein IID45_14480 [Planctomycetes bacterium]|nr:hypothetical protein [Planctomycetota bacterium]